MNRTQLKREGLGQLSIQHRTGIANGSGAARDEMLARAARVIPRGALTGRIALRDLIVGSQGAYLWNSDGKRYIDCLLSGRAIVIGHSDPRVNRAVARAGASYDLNCMGPQPGEVELAEAIRGSNWTLYFRSGTPTNYKEAVHGLDHSRAQAYWGAMLDQGVLEPPFPPGDRRLCVATSEEDIDMTIEAASRAPQRASSAFEDFNVGIWHERAKGMSMKADDEGRAQAVRRLWAKRGFKIHLTAFAIVSLAMLLVWATASRGDYFWPIWPIAGWGIGLAVHAWITFGQWSLSEAEIQREMTRGQERAQQRVPLNTNERS